MVIRSNKVFVILLWLILSPCGFAAELHDVQSWWNVTATGPIYKGKERSNFKFWLEGIQRLGDYNSRSTQRLLRPGLGYALNETTSVWLGTAWIETAFPLNQVTVGEKRIWQQLLWVKKYALLKLNSRLRFEQRFFSNNPVVGWRLRQQLKMVVPLLYHPKWSLVGSNEVFFYKGHVKGRDITGFDQNRFFMGVGHEINKEITIEIGYLNQYIARYHSPNFLSNNLATNVLFKF